MTATTQDIRLIFKIDNKQPIELIDLTRSLISLASQFDKYSSKFGSSKENREAKLYVKEIKSGSVIVELMELATVGLLPFVENSNTIIDFTAHLKTVVQYFINGQGSKPELSAADYKDIASIVNPVAKDNASQLNISTTVNGNVTQHFYLNSLETNALQNICKNEIEELKVLQQSENANNRLVLTWYQARNDPKAITGNKGIIEELSVKPMNIIFDSDALQAEMLHSDINPFNTAFVVDVKIQNIQGIPRVYKILKLHEYFEINP